MSAKKTHCCSEMESMLKMKCDVHSNKYECSDNIVTHSNRYEEYEKKLESRRSFKIWVTTLSHAFSVPNHERHVGLSEVI